MADFGGMFDSDQESGDDVIDHIPKTPGPVTMHHDSGEDEEEDEDENDGDEQHQQQQQQQQERREQNDEESGSDDSEDENQYQKNVQEEDEESGNQESRAKSSDEGSGSEQESEDEKPARNRVTSQSEENDSEVERSGDEKSVSEGPGSPQQESDSEADIQRPEPSESSRDGGGEDGEENEANKILAGGQSNREVEEDSDEEPQKSRQEIMSEDEQSKSDNDDNDEQREQAPPDEDSNDSNDSGPQKRKLSIVEDRDSDSDQDSDGPPRSERKKVKIDSDEDEDAMEENDSPRKDSVTANTKEIFGELSSEGEENEEKKASTVREEPRRVRYDSDGNEDISRVGDDDNRRDENNTSVYFGDEPPEEPVPETRIDVEIPRIVANLGQEITFVKLPNFLSVDTHPYQPDWYDEEGLDDEEGGFDDEGRARVKLKVENTMRWRAVVGENGEQVKESNTRMVKWSDGSMSLYLGSEIFDVHKQQLMPGENNHLFVRQGTGLQGQAVFRNKLTFRPHSTDSFTHRKMTISLADRSQKTQKIRVLAAVGDDPEADRREKLKREEDKLKASLRRESKQRRMRERVNTRGPTASYLENDNYDDEDDEGAISLSAIKNKYKKGNVGYNVYTESEGSDDSDDILDRKKSNAEKKKPQIVDSEDED